MKKIIVNWKAIALVSLAIILAAVLLIIFLPGSNGNDTEESYISNQQSDTSEPSFITYAPPSHTRNEWHGWLGYEFAAHSNVLVTALGRPTAGMAQSHRIALWDVSTGEIIAEVTITADSPARDGFTYEMLTAPVPIASGGRYVMVSFENNNSEHAWYEAGYSGAMPRFTHDSAVGRITSGAFAWDNFNDLPGIGDNPANVFVGPTFWHIPDTQVLPTGSGTGTAPEPYYSYIAVNEVMHNSVRLNWASATVNGRISSQLQYFVYKSNSANIGTLEAIDANGTRVNTGPSRNIDTLFVHGLVPETTYYFNVVVVDSSGNRVAYDMTSATTYHIDDVYFESFLPEWSHWFNMPFVIWGTNDAVIFTFHGNTHMDVFNGEAWAPADSVFDHVLIVPNAIGMGMNLYWFAGADWNSLAYTPTFNVHNLTTDSTMVNNAEINISGGRGVERTVTGFLRGHTYRIFGNTGHEPFSFYVVIGDPETVIAEGRDIIGDEEGPVRHRFECPDPENCPIHNPSTIERIPLTYAQRLRQQNPGGNPVNIQTFEENGNEVRIVLLDQDVLRVRVGPGGRFANDYNPDFAVVKTDDMWPGAVNLSDDPNIIDTGRMRVYVTYNPLTLNIFDADGNPYITDWVIDFETTQASWNLLADEHIYGFGDVRSHLDKRGSRILTRNSDSNFHWGANENTGYKIIPMYWSSGGYGVFLNNWWPGAFDIGFTGGVTRESTAMPTFPAYSVPAGLGADITRIYATGGEIDLYIFGGPDFTDIVYNYTRLTGRPAMLPRWFFGFHQGGAMNRTSQAHAIEIARNMRAANLPIDAIYYDDFWPGIFTPDFICRMQNQYNIQITIGMGMPYDMQGTPVWNGLNSLEPRGLIVGLDGEPLLYDPNFYGGVLRTEFDFFSDAASDVVFDEIWRDLLLAGAWNGMLDFGEMDFVPNQREAFFPSFGAPSSSGARTVFEMANVNSLVYFEQLVTRAAALSNSRYVGMPRAGWAGTQRYGWTFTGDNRAEWSNWNGFPHNLRSVLNMTMSGFSNVGIGGIGGWTEQVPNDQLFIRWMQAEMWLPYAASHGIGTKTIYDRPGVVDIARDSLNRRYELLPYYYSLMLHAHLTGTPIVRTLAFETNAAPGTENISDQFFVGPFIMVAPVVTQQFARPVFLPEGIWISGNDVTQIFEGGQTIVYDAPIEITPFFYKAGAIVTRGPQMQHTSELPLDPLTIDYFPYSQRTSFTLFEDDGHMGFENGMFSTTDMYGIIENGTITFIIEERNIRGGYDPGRNNITLNFRNIASGNYTITVNGYAVEFTYDAASQTISLTIPDTAQRKIIVVQVR